MQRDPDVSAHVDYQGTFSPLKAWLLSPGYRVVRLYRSAARLQRTNLFGKVLARLLWMRIVRGYGCYISPKAKIGPGLSLPHPVAIVVGEGCILGKNVRLYQSVTLGRRNDTRAEYPILEDDVTVYAGAVLIGAITVGKGAVIGANALVTQDVPPGAVVVQNVANTMTMRLP